MIEFKLPDIGEGVAEGEIVKWLVSEGDVVAEHQSIVEVMTDKATVEVPAPAAGRIDKILAAEGDSVPVGSVIYHLAGDGAAAAPAAAPAVAAAPTPAAPAPASGGAVIEFKLPDVGEGVAEGIQELGSFSIEAADLAAALDELADSLSAAERPAWLRLD